MVPGAVFNSRLDIVHLFGTDAFYFGYGFHNIRDINTRNAFLSEEYALGYFVLDHYAWVLEEPELFDRPIPATGNKKCLPYDIRHVLFPCVNEDFSPVTCFP